MNKQNVILFIALILFFVSCTFAQTKPLVLPKPTPTPAVPAPGNIKLLAGYVHMPEQGIDTTVGTIKKENGLKIEYDIGKLAGNYAEGFSSPKEDLLWFKIQETNGLKVMITYLKNGSIFATFPDSDANFISIVKTNEELADFLIMVMTYGSDPKPKDKDKDKEKRK